MLSEKSIFAIAAKKIHRNFHDFAATFDLKAKYIGARRREGKLILFLGYIIQVF
jgi:hypothetical protein